MRAILISTLAAALFGCTSLPPPQFAANECTNEGAPACLDETFGPRVEPKPVVFKADPVARHLKTTASAKMDKPSSQLGDKLGSTATHAKAVIATKEDTPSSAPRADKSDPVINRAKSTVAAKMEDPASAEFIEMKRAIRKNTLGMPLDTICGHVKGKHATGQDTGAYAFLYLVKENDAYIVNDTGDVTADAAYRNICN